ncbi:NUDIX domain-containing protein [Kitasatospora sp. NPDC001540]|uniref:NUDIX domain-containing protein n=1 Tax=Kitasatospora sp. NPDC001540 TaxID=3364014 RepID=UPI0036D1C2FC
MARSDIQRDGHPRRRLACVTVITLKTTHPTDPRNGSVLMIEADHKARPILPGGAANPGEPIGAAVSRELLEATGLRRTITWGLAVDQADADPGLPEDITIVCEGGTLSEAEAEAMSIPITAAEEIKGLVWIRPSQLDEALEPHQAARIRSALAARDSGHGLPLLQAGVPYLGADAAA